MAEGHGVVGLGVGVAQGVEVATGTEDGISGAGAAVVTGTAVEHGTDGDGVGVSAAGN